MVKLVKVVSNDPATKSTTYLADDGNTYVLKGDLSARANNPGNISPTGGKARSTYESNFGAIGYLPSSNGPPVAVFPDISSGQAAQSYLWQTPAYQNRTLEQAARAWASSPYVDALVSAAGVPGSTLVKDLTPDQLAAVTSTQVGREGSGKLRIMDANGKPVPLDLAGSLGAIRLPPADIPSTAVGTQLDTNPPASYKIKSGDTLGKIAGQFGTTVQQLAQANGIADPNKIKAGATLKIGAPPPLPPSTFGGRLPAQAQYGIDRLVPGQVTQPPNDFTTNTGAPDLRAFGMTLPQGVLGAAGRAGAGIGAPGAASLAAMPPLPIPRPVTAPPTPVQVQPPQLPAQRPSAPVAPPQQQQLRLASGQMIAPGIYDQGDHSVMVSDAGDGTAKVERVRGPMSIPGVIDPLREANANTIAGGMIRKMLPGQLAGNASGFVPAVTDNVKSAAVGAAQNLGNSIGGMFGGLGSMFAPKPPSLPTFAQLQAIRAVPANSYYRPAPMPMSRPLSFFAQPVPQAPTAVPVVARSAAPSQSNGGGYANGRQNAINDTLRTLGFNV